MRRFHVIILSLCLAYLLLAAGCTQSVSSGDHSPTQSGPVTTVSGQDVPKTTFPVAPAATVAEVQKRGTSDPDFIVDIAVPDKIWPGTTLLADNHDLTHPRIIEVNRLGEIVWEYPLADELKEYTNPGWDVELLQNGNILTVLPRKGVYEINRDKQVVWKYSDPKVSHDVDRLPNGNTLIAFGAYDTKDDAQVKEVDSRGTVVWSWHARDSFDQTPLVLSLMKAGRIPMQYRALPTGTRSSACGISISS